MSDIVERLRAWSPLIASGMEVPAAALAMDEAAAEITRLRAGLQRIVEGDGFWDAPSLARDLLEGKNVT
jgi:hypothetical protein